MTIHYAPNELDVTLTACNKPVGYILAETEDEVTLTAHDATCAACKDYLRDAEAYANEQIYGAR